MEYIEESKASYSGGPKLLKDEFQKHEYVDANFPFASIEGEFKCPYWVKCFLKEKYNIRESRKIIELFNTRDSHPAKMSKHFEQDVDIEPFSDYEVYLMQQKFKKEGTLTTETIFSDLDDEELGVSLSP